MELKQTKILLSNLIEFVSLKYEQSKALLPSSEELQNTKTYRVQLCLYVPFNNSSGTVSIPAALLDL